MKWDDLLQQILDCKTGRNFKLSVCLPRICRIRSIGLRLVKNWWKQHVNTTLWQMKMKIVIPLRQFLFSEVVEPKIGQEAPVGFIISLLPKPRLHSLAQKIAGVAERFEFYYKGLELANGFHELTDARTTIPP